MAMMRFRIATPKQMQILIMEYGLWGDRAVNSVNRVWSIARSAGPTPWDNAFEVRFEEEPGEEPVAHICMRDLRYARVQYNLALAFCRECMQEIVEEVTRQ